MCCFTDELSFHVRLGICPQLQYEDWYEVYSKEINNWFDKEIQELITKHWGDFTAFTMVKRDYNIVYSLTLANGQNCYVKVKPVQDKNRDDLDKLGHQEMAFVDFISKTTKLTSSFIQPGVVSTKHFNINMVTAEPGVIA